MATAHIHGIDMYYERHGDAGEPLVLVHGYTGDVTDWRHQIPEFSRTHRVLMMDHRGHGRSSAPKDRTQYTIEAMADDVEALAAEAGFARYHLLGHSMGGAVVQEIALRSPGRLLSLILHDTTYKFGLNSSEAVRDYLAKRHRVAEESGMAAVAEIPPLVSPPPHMPKERLEETKQRLSRMSVDAFLGAWNALSGWAGTEDRAQHIAAPTLVIYGDLDAAFIEPAAWFGKTIPNVTVEPIAECGHSPQFERPALYNAALRHHLDRNAGAAAK